MSYPYARAEGENVFKPHFYIGHYPVNHLDLRSSPSSSGAHVCANCFNVWVGSMWPGKHSIGPCCGYLWEERK
jgi:hypothetical protein